MRRVRKDTFQSTEITNKLSEKRKEISQYKALVRGLPQNRQETRQLDSAIESDGSNGISEPHVTSEDLRRNLDLIRGENDALEKRISERARQHKADITAIEQQVSVERDRAVQLSHELEKATSVFEMAKEEYKTREQLVQQLRIEIDKVKEKEALLVSPNGLDKERILLEKMIAEYTVTLNNTEKQLANLKEKDREIEEKYSQTRQVVADLEKTIKEIDMECISKSEELNGMRRECVRLENEIMNDSTQKKDLVRQINMAKNDSKLLDRKLLDLTRVNDQAQIRFSELNRDYTRALRLNEGLTSEYDRLRYDLDSKINHAKILRHEQAFIIPSVTIEHSPTCDAKRVSLLQQECVAIENEISAITTELNNMQEKGMLDESGRLKPVVISDPQLREIVEELGINQALLSAQEILDNEESMKEVVTIVAIMLDRIDSEHRHMQEVYRSRAFKSMAMNHYVQSLDFRKNMYAELVLSNLQLDNHEISKLIDAFNDEQRGKIEYVDVSNNALTCASAFSQIIESFPNLKELVLVGNSQDAITDFRKEILSKHVDATDDGICLTLCTENIPRISIVYHE